MLSAMPENLQALEMYLFSRFLDLAMATVSKDMSFMAFLEASRFTSLHLILSFNKTLGRLLLKCSLCVQSNISC